MDADFQALVNAAADRYRGAGRYAWHFAKGKLGRDPVFHFLLKQGVLPQQGRLYDLGCGQGVLLSLLQAASQRFAEGGWPPGWPAPPRALQMHGVELRSIRAKAARIALGDEAAVTLGDVREVEIPRCAAITILDVLVYLQRDQQRAVLEKCARAVEPGGVLLLREADARGGAAFHFTHWAERVACWTRGQFRQRLVYRPADEWKELLASLGFAVSAQPMSAGTPFGNVLYLARQPG